MTKFEIVMKLIGPVQPVGETHVDGKRWDNMIELVNLTSALVDEIIDAADYADRHEASMKKIGTLARGFLGELKEVIEENGDGS